MQHDILVGGELMHFDSEHTTVYMFPNQPEMNHVYVGEIAVVIRGCPGLTMTLLAHGYPVSFQPHPRKVELEAYDEYVVGLTSDLDEFEGEFDEPGGS